MPPRPPTLCRGDIDGTRHASRTRTVSSTDAHPMMTLGLLVRPGCICSRRRETPGTGRQSRSLAPLPTRSGSGLDRRIVGPLDPVGVPRRAPVASLAPKREA
jgi:hypothetical protein